MIEHRILRAAIVAALTTASLGGGVVMSSGVAMAAHVAHPVKLALADGRTIEFTRGPSGPQQLIDGHQAADGVYPLQSGGRIKIGPESREDYLRDIEFGFFLHLQFNPKPSKDQTELAAQHAIVFDGGSITHPDKLPPGVAARIRAIQGGA
jgi:hypothetical protein